ncbi:MAG TPA: hopanoid biosynthesis-associated protein HpnK [Gemmatimonadaceae bacterium]
MVRRVIITADDFGLAIPVNEAVELAHREGILGCASLMVAEEAAADAVARARRLPTLRVGLHVVVVDGRPALPATVIPDLVDANGRLGANMFRTSVRIFFVPSARRQLRAEVRAQFEAFRATGLPLDHVNAHRHMHLHPTVLGAILAVAPEFGVRAVRLPREPLRATRTRPLGRRIAAFGWSAFLAPWLALVRWRLARAGIRCNSYVLGLGDSGAMEERTVAALVGAIPDGITEIYFHPATNTRSGGVPLPMPAARHEAELQALCSARVRAALDGAGVARVTFGELA